MLEDERKAISKFIEKHNITVISEEEFEKDTVTDVSKNEYVYFSNGVYMQIIDRGTADTLRTRDEILVRMAEYNVMAEIDNSVSADTISNVEISEFVDAFYYSPSSSNTEFHEGWFPYVYMYGLQYSQGIGVPNGLTYALRYVRDKARFKLIIPSKMGHSYSSYYVYPMYYDVRKIQIR